MIDEGEHNNCGSSALSMTAGLRWSIDSMLLVVDSDIVACRGLLDESLCEWSECHWVEGSCREARVPFRRAISV